MESIVSHRSLASLALIGSALAIAAPQAAAGFTHAFTPSYRGQPNTHFAGWESFTYAYAQPNLPDDAQSTSTVAQITQLDASVFLSGGNFYSFGTTVQCELGDAVPADLQRVALQTSTKGNELDYDNVRLTYVDENDVVQTVPWTARTELWRLAIMGFDVETLFEWDLTGVHDTITTFELRFEGAQPSMSLDAVLLDVQHIPLPSIYCTAKTNSVGCAPQIGFTGTPSANATSGFDVTATSVINNKNGLFFYGLNGAQALAFQGGILCVKAPIKRTPVQGSGGTPPPNNCSGSFSLDFNAFIASGQDANLVAGRLVHGQYWYRDPGFSVPNNTGLTNALAFTILN